MDGALRKPMTREEFFDWAASRPGRYEFDGHEPVGMTGGTNNHGRIARNILVELHTRLRGTPCEVLGSDAGGVATHGNRVRYPEASVTCTQMSGKGHLVPDPVVVFEVTSPTSAHMDHAIKLREYHSVPSIRSYVVVEQEGVALTIHTRSTQAPWSTCLLVQGDTLDLPEIGIAVEVDAFYTGVAFDPPPTP